MWFLLWNCKNSNGCYFSFVAVFHLIYLGYRHHGSRSAMRVGELWGQAVYSNSGHGEFRTPLAKGWRSGLLFQESWPASRFMWKKCHHLKPQVRTQGRCRKERPEPLETGPGLRQHIQKGLPGMCNYDSMQGVLGIKCLKYLAVFTNPWRPWCCLCVDTVWCTLF